MVWFFIQSFSACQIVFILRIPSLYDLAFSVYGQGSGPKYPSLKIEFRGASYDLGLFYIFFGLLNCFYIVNINFLGNGIHCLWPIVQ